MTTWAAPTFICRNNCATNGRTTYSYDGASRLSAIEQAVSGSTNDVNLGFSYNPASQIVSRTVSKAQYRWSTPTTANLSYDNNGLDQYTTITGVSPGPLYDNYGNLGRLGATTYPTSLCGQRRLFISGSASPLHASHPHSPNATGP